MGKKMVSNPVGGGAIAMQFLTPPDVLLKINQLEAELWTQKNLPPKIKEVEKVVEVEVVKDNPLHIQKIKKLEAQLADLKARGAYQNVKDSIQLISPNVEQKAMQAPLVEEKATMTSSWRNLGIAFTAGTFLGAMLWQLFTH